MVTETCDRQRIQPYWERYLCAASREFAAALQRAPDLFPHFTEGGRWQLLPAEARSSWNGPGVYEHGNWTAGFWFGVMWLLSLGRDDEEPAKLARRRLKGLLSRAYDSTTHDLGFLFYPAVALAEQTGLVEGLPVTHARTAARVLASRFNARGGYIQAFGPIGEPQSAPTSTIDTMMNLPLLWWAASKGEDPLLFQVAAQHARTSARVYLRPDGSTWHLLRFEPLSGRLVSRGTFQGLADKSCWSRGQAWAIAGFAWAYAATGESELLEAAERALTYFLAQLPDDLLPPWDFGDRSPDCPRDASAAVAAVLGMLILSEIHPHQARAQAIQRQAIELLEPICRLSLNKGEEVDGILLHSCYSRPHGQGINGAMAWGDFYLGLVLAMVAQVVSFEDAVGFHLRDDYVGWQP